MIGTSVRRAFLKRVSAIPLFAYLFISSAAAQKTPVRLDSSDWWSYTRQEELPQREPQPAIHAQNREVAESNFQIAGITLDTSRHDFSEIRSKFGEVTEVQRGDAASGRNQICYASPTRSVHLIFEFGEINSVLYLFENGKNWNGSELCAASNAVASNISTASGLRLGISPEQVKSILGDPSTATPTALIYYFSYKSKTSPEDLAEMRKSYPDMSDAAFRENFEFADTEAYIEARFDSGKLNYLAISISDTY